MPRNGSGGYTPPSSSWNPAVNGASALPADWNALLSDLSAAIQGSIAADGQTPMTGDLDAGNNQIVDLAAPTANGQALRLQQVLQGPDIASATTPTIPLEGGYFLITGTTTITGFGATSYGRMVWVKFDGALTLTHSSTFQLPDSVDITTAAGDVAGFIYDVDGWNCVVYRAVNAPYTIRYLAVAGGGGASSTGGAAGGFKEDLAVVKTGQSYAITIGVGGTGNTTSPTNGGDTIAAGIATATGGARGSQSGAGFSGGSGSGAFASGSAGTGIIGQGFDGGASNTNGGGGSGGAGGKGQDAPVNGAGYGGPGLPSSISGSTRYYAAGGGSIGNGSPFYAPGGSGIGGNGGFGAVAATAGATNTGSGGGAHDTAPKNGADGIFVLSYPGTPRGTGGTITQVGGNTIHTFTSNGTFVA